MQWKRYKVTGLVTQIVTIEVDATSPERAADFFEEHQEYRADVHDIIGVHAIDGKPWTAPPDHSSDDPPAAAAPTAAPGTAS